MRILLTTDTVGGVWDHTVTLARALDAAGHAVLIAAIGEPRDVRLARLPEGVQYTSRVYRLEWMPDAEEDVAAAAAWLRDLALLWRADVVHLNQMAYAAFGFPAPVLAAVHSDVHTWWVHVLGGTPPRRDWSAYTGWVTEGLAAADAVVAPTGWQAEQVREHYGVDAVRVIHNGVEPPAGGPAPRDGFLVVSVGRLWDRGKGADVLDAAAGLLGADVHALGEITAPHGESFVALHLRTHGRVERAQVDAWLRRASVYVAPSRYEPFGLAPLEAAMHGCALVLSDLPTFRELWDGCAEFVPVGDAVALARALARLQQDEGRVRHLAAGARKRALRRYGAGRMAAQYVELYEQILGAHATTSHAVPTA